MSKDNSSDPAPLRPETLAAQACNHHDELSGGIVPALQPATTYIRRAQDYELVGSTSYSRDHNPTYEAAEDTLAALEGGAAAALFASGLGAAAALVQTLKPGDHIVAQRSMYWGLRNWLESFTAQWGLDLDLIDVDGLGSLKTALRPGETKLVWLESPSNPLWQVIDLEAAAALVKPSGALLAVDNTCATPVLTRPLALGADVVMHSATKYLNGHSDVVAGALVTARKDETWERTLYNRSKLGAVLGPFEAWLLLRGMRTLFIRVERAGANALAIAQHFDGHPKVDAVLYPGLPGHPGHDIAKRQMQGGFGGMMSLRVAGGWDAAQRVAGRCRVFARATSLGGVESLIEHRAAIEGDAGGVPGDLLRLSVGIEAASDLIADLEQALA